MDELWESFVDLDMNSKYFETVPYDSDDPDFTWYKNFPESDENDESSTRPSESSAKDREKDSSEDTNSKSKIKRRRCRTPSSVYAQGGVYSILKLEEFVNTKQKNGGNRKSIRWNQRFRLSNEAKISDSDTDDTDTTTDVIRRHQRLMPGNDGIKLKKDSTDVNAVNNTVTVLTGATTNSLVAQLTYNASPQPSSYCSINTNQTKTLTAPLINKIGTTATVSSLNTRVTSDSSVSQSVYNANLELPNNYSLNSSIDGNCFNNSFPNNWQTVTTSPVVNQFLPPFPTSTYDSPTTEQDTLNNSLKMPYKRFRKNSSLNRDAFTSTELMPQFRNHQLLGDSQLLRFSEQFLNIKAYVTFTSDTNSRSLGYCVSGQKIKELEQRLLKKEFKLSDKVILLIGTNDLIQDTELKSMCESYDSILNILTKNTDRIVILTVPPVPKLCNKGSHWVKLKQFNRFLISRADEKKIFVVDLGSHYSNLDNMAALCYFEQAYYKQNSKKVDLVHLNRQGFKLLRAVLEINYFDRFYLKHK